MNNRSQTILLQLTFLLILPFAVQGQELNNGKLLPRAISYGFVSPNTREDLPLETAIKNLDSEAENRLVQETRRLGCRLRAKLLIKKALGNWADGAEPSLVFRNYSDEPTVRYAAASLGKRWRQKTVLYFQRQASGKARMYVISVRRRQRRLNLMVQTVARALDDAGVSFRTLVPLKTRVIVYVVDLSNDLQPQLRKAAAQLHARALSFTGSGAFIGNDNDRDKSQEIFAREVQAYETNHSLNRQGCRPNKRSAK